MNKISKAVKAASDWFLTNMGPIGFWAIIFIAVGLLIVMTNVNYEIEANHRDNKAFAEHYNATVDAVFKALGLIKDEETTRLSGDNEFTKTNKQFIADFERAIKERIEWQKKMEDKLDAMISVKMGDRFTGHDYDVIQGQAKAQGINLPERPHHP
jgi:hypothetical protein